MHYHPRARLAASLLPLGLAALQAPALAQSNLQVFGTLDMNLTHTRAGGKSNTAMDQGANLMPSRLGFRGSEDLGSGLSASFWLESALLPDTGQVQGAFFHRRSTLSLASQSWGELRLGRDYTPTFWNISQFSAFGTVSVGGSSNIVEGYPMGQGGANTLVRSNNSLGYFLPKNPWGIYGQAMMNFSEGQQNTRFRGARLGYAQGAADMALAYGSTRIASGSYRVLSLGGSYRLPFAKLYANWLRHSAPGEHQTNVMLGATVPAGTGEVKLSVARSQRGGQSVERSGANQYAVGYVHPLSKRTAVYGMLSRISNQGSATYVTSDSSPEARPGGMASGVQFGISHNF